MKKTKLRLLLLLFFIGGLIILPQKANADEVEAVPVSISVKYGQTEARTILDMINEARTNSEHAWYWNKDDTTKTFCTDLKELEYDYDLERVAMKRAAEIALSYDHERPIGGYAWDTYGQENIRYSHAGENIAAAQTTASQVNFCWREDNEPYGGQGHRRNMLSSKFNCVGIGHVYYNGVHYWVEEFAYRTSVNTTETTANDSEQVMSLSVPKSKATGLKVAFDKTSYILRPGESAEVNFTTKVTAFGRSGTVTDMPDISVDDPSIATYSNGKISGVAEGTTTLTASLYGLTAADLPTINVHECDKYWNQGEITTEPNCIKEGEKTFTCTICGNTNTKKVNATGHSYGAYKVVKEPTNKRKGLKSKTCSVCGKIVYEAIPKTNFSPTDSSETNPDQNPQTSQKTTRKIKLNRRKLTLKKGRSFRLKVTLTPEDSQDKIIYRTSNKKIAAVSKTGKIRAKKKGKARITVISGKKKVICKVTVK